MFSTPFPSTLPTCFLTPSEADPPEWSPDPLHDPLLHHDSEPTLPDPLNQKIPPSVTPRPPATDVSVTDGGIFWFHNVPLWRHGILGRGGFATVHKVEVLVSANSGPEFFGVDVLNAGDSSTGEEDQHDASDAILQHFEDIMVKQRVEEQRTSGCSLPPSAPLHATRTPVDDRRLRYSGRFFALKMQTAENEQQMEHFAKEAEKLRKLRGRAQIVEIKGHMLLRESLEVAILMELAACDLGFFLQKTTLPTFPNIARVWCALVSAVDVAHREDIIHRDLKPQNFLLVPLSTAYADRVLATTNVAEFEFRAVDEDESAGGSRGVVAKLAVTDADTGLQSFIPLTLKLTDFGLAQGLALDSSHVSVKNPAGTLKYDFLQHVLRVLFTVVMILARRTLYNSSSSEFVANKQTSSSCALDPPIVSSSHSLSRSQIVVVPHFPTFLFHVLPRYMAPETLKPSKDGRHHFSKAVDVWSLGVILFQMLHGGRTPFDCYLQGNQVGAAVAIASKDVLGHTGPGAKDHHLTEICPQIFTHIFLQRVITCVNISTSTLHTRFISQEHFVVRVTQSGEFR